jgi:hypothetical protein
MILFRRRPAQVRPPLPAAVAFATHAVRFPAAGVLLLACLCACAGRSVEGPPSPSAAATIPVATISPTAGPTADPGNVTPITAEPEPAPLDRPLYRLRAAVDTSLIPTEYGEMMLLTVKEEAAYTHRGQAPLEELILQFEPSRRTELFFLDSLSSNRAARGGRAEIRDGQLRIPLEEPLTSGAGVVLRLEYRRFIACEPELIGRNDTQILLGNWYAFFPPYREGTGWLAHPPGKAGEYLNFPYADFDVSLELPAEEGYQVAASGVADAETTPLHYLFTGRSFAVSLTRQTLFRRSAGEVEILAYARPEHEAQGGWMADTAARALGLYSDLLAEYPHRRLTVVESDLYDGMEFDGLVFLSPSLFEYYTGDGKDYLTAITAHETVHQWWYGRVGNDQAMEPWLDEAFAAYHELLYYERFHPDHLEWWWWTRVNRYPSDDCVDLPVYSFPDFRTYVNAVYLRGVHLLHALRLRMGKAAFLDSLRELQTEHFGGWITAADVLRSFESHSAAPLTDIWADYLCQPLPAEPG